MKILPRPVEAPQQIPNKNDIAAKALRERFQEAGVCVISLVSSPGSGKTSFLQHVLCSMRQEFRLAALVGDLATDNDSLRLSRSQVPVKQIITRLTCRLDASMLSEALEDWNLADLDFLFIENVGNLVCPSSYDLGENARVVLLSVAEGEDKPLKYPSTFQTADAAIITKMDLEGAVEFDATIARQNLNLVRPGIEIFPVSVRAATGLCEVVSWIKAVRCAMVGLSRAPK